MDKFVASIRKKYSERLVQYEEQWPPVRGNELINLQLVETDKTEGFLGSSDTNVKRSPLLYGDLFSTLNDDKVVRKVIVEGNAGIGKTILCQMIAQGWAEGKIMTKFECVFLLALREQLVSSATNLPELFKLLHSSEKIRTSTIEQLEEQEGDNILIIADGWDELDSSQRCRGSFLYNLLFGSTLPLASVLLTSRPSASAALHDLPSVDRLVEVVGFNEENIRQYIKSEFKTQPVKASTLIEQLDNNPLVSSICSIPLNCAIVCNLWHTMNQVLPTTVTELYAQIVLNILLRDFKKKSTSTSLLTLANFDSIPGDMQDSFWVICKFAYKSLEKDLLVFTRDELASLVPESDTTDVIACCGLLQCSRSLLPVGHGLSFHFAHLLIQEFLAALHLWALPTSEKLQACKLHASSSRFSMVWRFVFGLDYNKNRYSIRKINTFDKEVVEEFVSRNRRRFLQLCHCAMESGTQCVSTKIATIANGHFELTGKSGLVLYDCTAVCHVLKYTTGHTQLSIALSGCGLNHVVLQKIADLLYCGKETVTIRKLNLSNNQLSTNAITDLFQRVPSSLRTLENLDLSGNNIATVHPCLHECHCLTELSLSDNPLGVPGFQSLNDVLQTQALDQLVWLSLANTLTSDPDINGALLAQLLQSVASYCPQVKSINLSDNNLGVPGACALGEALPMLTCGKSVVSLNLRATNLNSEALTAFSIVVNENPASPFCNGILNLFDNPVGYDGLLAIFRILQRKSFQITEIVLSDISLGNQKEKLNFGPTIEDCSLERLEFVGTNFSGDKILVLAECIRVCQFSLKSLHTTSPEFITSSDLILLLSLLESNGTVCTKLKEWTLQTTVDDEGANVLIRCLNKIFPSLVLLNMTSFMTDETKRRLKDCVEANNKRRNVWLKQAIIQRPEWQEKKRKRAVKAEQSAMLDKWIQKGNAGLPQNMELRSLVLNMWDVLIWEMCYLICVVDKYPHLFGLPLREDVSPDCDSPSATSSDDEESFFSAPEAPDEDEPENHYQYATNHETICRKPCPEITLKLLNKELETLTRPIQFGVMLGIPQDRIEILQQDYRQDTEGQKMALFQFIAKNYKSLGITWGSIADALLEIHAGNLSIDIRQKYTGMSQCPPLID